MIIKDYIQGSKEWLEMRKSHIMASDTPVIMGESPWSTPLKLWEQKLGITKQQDQTIWMKRGLELEPLARAAYNNHTGNQAEPCVVFSEDYTYMGASLDGLSADKLTIVEIKCPGQKDHDLAASGKVPKKYWGQLQHQLATSSLNLLHYFSYKDNNFHLIEVKRDEDYIKKMITKHKEFWKCMISFKAPDIDQNDIVTKRDSKWIQVTSDLMEVYEQLAPVEGKLQELNDKRKELEKLLIEETKGQSCHGNGIKALKVHRKGVIDYMSIPEIKEVNLEKYRKAPSIYWRITKTD